MLRGGATLGAGDPVASTCRTIKFPAICSIPRRARTHVRSWADQTPQLRVDAEVLSGRAVGLRLAGSARGSGNSHVSAGREEAANCLCSARIAEPCWQRGGSLSAPRPGTRVARWRQVLSAGRATASILAAGSRSRIMAVGSARLYESRAWRRSGRRLSRPPPSAFNRYCGKVAATAGQDRRLLLGVVEESCGRDTALFGARSSTTAD